MAATQLVVFTLGGEQYGLPITRVQEIIRYTEPRSVTSGSPLVRGVINLRGRIIPVLDVALEIGCAHDAAQAEIVIVETPQGTVGMIVDDVDEVLEVDETQLAAIPTARQGLDTVATVGERLIVLLDPQALAVDEIAA